MSACNYCNGTGEIPQPPHNYPTECRCCHGTGKEPPPSADLNLSQFEGMTARITEYLCVGGMWNPELMEHDKVRDLLVEMRAAVPSLIAEVKRQAQQIAELERDRERMDWLQANPPDGHNVSYFNVPSGKYWWVFGTPKSYTDVRAAIDAAMQTNPEP